MKSCYKQIFLICKSRSTATYYNLYELRISVYNYSFANKIDKAVDLKLQHRISRNNSSIISYNSDIAP